MKNRSILIILFFVTFSFFSLVFQTKVVRAQNLVNSQEIEELSPEEAESATSSDRLATPSAAVVEKIQEKKDQDITETGGEQKNKLELYLDDNPPEALNWNNFIQHAIRQAVSNGLPVNVLVLLLLFPLIASFIAASRHIVGLRGFGIYIPAVLSVALVSTGVIEGLLIFFVIAIAALIAKRFLKIAKISYLPRTALLLWIVSLGIFATLLVAPFVKLTTLLSVNIFPILILILLAENFLDAQARTKQTEALALTIETIALAVVSGYLLKWVPLQQFALSEPELLIFFSGAINILIGKFAGLRISERLRFRSLIEEEE